MLRRIWALLVALALSAGLLTALAEADMPAAMPEIGGVVNGFELVEARPFRLYNATVYHFVHQRTGAQAIYIKCEDTNRAFDLSFATQAIDNTGLPHVFEHATALGSEKYPSRDLFKALSHGSYLTYLNAKTNQNMTSYPVSSLSEAQLLKLADYYTSCCLHPLIMEDEDIFRTEAWRYRLENPEDPLTIEGTVYSEIRGISSLDLSQTYNALRVMMPGSYVGNICGGDPDYIPDMTYEALKAYHEKYYHPSNSVAWLYGKLDHYDDFLGMLDKAYTPYERREFIMEDPDYTPISAPVEREFSYPVETGSDASNASMTSYAFVCPGLKEDAKETQAVIMLTKLLNHYSSSLSQAMREALPTAGFSPSVEIEGPDIAVIFEAYNVNREDAQTFKAIVDDSIADIAENGFAADMIDAVAAATEISQRFATESSKLGLGLIDSMMNYYYNLGSYNRYIDAIESVENLRQWHEAGLYSEMAQKWLVNNPRTALVTTYPEPGLKEQKDAALAEKLQAIKAGMNAEEIDAIVEASNTQRQTDPNTAALLQSLTAVTVATLPEEARTYPISDTTDENGIRHIGITAQVEDIAEVTLKLDACAMPQEDLHWMKLYTNLLLDMDTTGHTSDELSVLVNRYLYGVSWNLSTTSSGKPFSPTLDFSWISLDADAPVAFDLVREILFETRFDDIGRLKDNVDYMVTAMRRGIAENPDSYEYVRALGRTNKNALYSQYINGLDYFAFLKDTAARLESDPEGVIEKLRAVQDYFNNSANAIVCVTGNEDSIALNVDLADQWLAGLENRPLEPVTYDIPLPAAREALIADTAIQYNEIVMGNDALAMDAYDPKADVVCRLITDGFLVPMLRDQYGVYDARIVHNNLGLYVSTSYDPNIAETFAVFEQLPDFMEQLPELIDQQTLDAYIMKVYSSYAIEGGEFSGASSALSRYLKGLPDDFAIQCMRSLKAMTPENLSDYAGFIRKLVEEGTRSTAGGAAAIEANAELFDVVLNPLGQED